MAKCSYFILFYFLEKYRIAECFACLVCTKWSNPMIHRDSRTRQASSTSATIRYLDWHSSLVVYPEDDQQEDRICGLQDIGGHIMKIPVIAFQILLCMRLQVCILQVVVMATILWNLLSIGL